MDWRDEVFKNFTLYVVTDLRGETSADLRKIEAAYRGGADMIQLRSKWISDAALLRVGEKIRKAAVRYRKLFFVNDRVDLAIVMKADGVHLGQDDMPLSEAHKLGNRAGMRFRFGISTHSLSQAIRAERQGADYVGVGPVFETPTKPGKTAVGLKLVKQVAGRIKIPVVAIGGVDLTNVRKVVCAGARRVAVVRAVLMAKDPACAAGKFKKILEK